MASVNGLIGRLRGDRMTALTQQAAGLAAEIAVLRGQIAALAAALRDHAAEQGDQVAGLNHSVLSMNHVVAQSAALTEAHHTLLLGLNHDVRAGSERALPLFLGYAERLRLDTDTAIGAAQVIERQLAILEDLAATSDTTAAT